MIILDEKEEKEKISEDTAKEKIEDVVKDEVENKTDEKTEKIENKTEDKIEVKEKSTKPKMKSNIEGPSLSFSLEARKLSEEPEEGLAEKTEIKEQTEEKTGDDVDVKYAESDKEFMEEYAKKALEDETTKDKPAPIRHIKTNVAEPEKKQETKAVPLAVKTPNTNSKSKTHKPVQKKLVEKNKPKKTVNKTKVENKRVKQMKKKAVKQKSMPKPKPKKVKKKKDPLWTWLLPTIIVVAILVVVLILIFSNKSNMGDDVLVTVNGEPIYAENVEKQYNMLPEQYQLVFTREVLLEQIIDELLLLQKAESVGVIVDDSEVDAFITNLLLINSLTQEEMEATLAQQGMTLAEFKEIYKKQMIINKLFNATYGEEYDVSDEELLAYYNENKASFESSEQVRASHILVCGQENMYCESNMTEKEALELAETIVNEVTITNFAEYATEYSTDLGSASQGGDIGFFPKGAMVAEFETAAFSAKVGEIVGPVKTDFGYHIIYVTNRTEADTILFDEVKEDIKTILLQEKASKLYSELVTKLRAEADIKYTTKETETEQTDDESDEVNQPEITFDFEEQETANGFEDEGDVLTGAVVLDEKETDETEVVAEDESCEDPAAGEGIVETEPEETESEPASTTITTTDAETLAKCLTNKGIVLYGDSGEDTQAQKALFGDAAQYLTFVDCDFEECTGINAYPTWLMGNTKVLGLKSLEKLQNLAKC